MGSVADTEDEGGPSTDGGFLLAYAMLRRLAHRKRIVDRAGASIQTTELVHEAYLRLRRNGNRWKSDGHFYAAAAEAMRQVLVERARRSQRVRHGGRLTRVEFKEDDVPSSDGGSILAVDHVLLRLERVDARKAEIVKMRYFVGYTIEETAERMGLSVTTVKSDWSFARAWMKRELQRRERRPLR